MPDPAESQLFFDLFRQLHRLAQQIVAGRNVHPPAGGLILFFPMIWAVEIAEPCS